MSEAALPAEIPVTDADLRNAGFPDGLRMATGLAVLFNEPLYQRCKSIAFRMSQAQGIVGPHLLGKPNACFAVVTRSLTWNLDPFAVAQATFEVSGKIGYEAKLVQAILENSGAIDGRVSFEYRGEWAKLRGKFKMEASGRDSTKKTPVADYTEEDEEGLSVIVRAQIKGEATPREEEFFMREMWPRNSVLWATRPRQQMTYASVKAFANIATPGIIMGLPFDVDAGGFYAGTGMETVGEGSTTSNPPRPGPFNRAAVGEQAKPEAHAEPEGEGRPAEDGGVSESGDVVEPPLARGLRLLLVVKTVNDVADLRASILEEILDDDAAVTAWHTACDKRSKELTTPPAAQKAAGGKAKGRG